MAPIDKLIAVISPDVYCDPEVRDKVKKIVKTEGYQAALKTVKVIKPKEINIEQARFNPLSNAGLKSPIEIHKLKYDSAAESLEPLYFWILDFISNMYKTVDKVEDNFVAAPGSGYFSELGQKATAMQEKAMSMLGSVNTVLKSLLNIIYDLKEFKIRLEVYNDFHSKDEQKQRAARYSLKQIWMDSVDIKRGNTSLKGLVQQFDYVTIIDAFMASDSLKTLEKLDLNDRVKRILEQRVAEFERWVVESEKELRKRYEIEKHYLRSQYSSIQLYSRWIAPYLKAANKLEQNATASAGLVTTFNTLLLELTVIGLSPVDVENEVQTRNLPQSFKRVKLREYSSVIVIEFKFRGIPQRVGQGYSFGGKTDVTFTAYALNKQEYEVLKKEIEKSTFGDVMGLIEGATKESLEEIRKDVESFLEEDKDEKEEKKEQEKMKEDVNPFTALFSGISSLFKSEEKKDEKEDLTRGIRPDDPFEKVIRSQAIIDAIDKCRTVFDTYKKGHQMPAFP